MNDDCRAREKTHRPRVASAAFVAGLLLLHLAPHVAGSGGEALRLQWDDQRAVVFDLVANETLTVQFYALWVFNATTTFEAGMLGVAFDKATGNRFFGFPLMWAASNDAGTRIVFKSGDVGQSLVHDALWGPGNAWIRTLDIALPAGHYSFVFMMGATNEVYSSEFEATIEGSDYWLRWDSSTATDLVMIQDLESDVALFFASTVLANGASAAVSASKALTFDRGFYGFSVYTEPFQGIDVHDFRIASVESERDADRVYYAGEPAGPYEIHLTSASAGHPPGNIYFLYADLPRDF